MGATVSVSSGGLNSVMVRQAQTYFRNPAMLRGFWKPIDKDNSDVVSLSSVHKFLSSSNPEYSVALCAGPFIGPFATSKFCLREAHRACINRDEPDFSSMTLREDELSIFLKHLFFFHKLYSLFGDAARHDSFISYTDFREAYEDMSDDNLHESVLQEAYADLGPNPTYGSFATHMSSVVFADLQMFSPGKAEAILIQQEEAWNQLSLSMRLPSPGGMEGSKSDFTMGKGVINVTWHSVASSEEWLGSIQSLAPAHFAAMLDQVRCTRCCFAECTEDDSVFITISWLRDNGELYEAFMKEQMSEGGAYQTAIEEELISPPFQSVQFMNSSHVGWDTSILPNDVLNMTSFNTQNYSSFSRAYNNSQTSAARDSHMLQSFFGKQLEGDGAGIIEHFDIDGWKRGGQEQAEAFTKCPTDSFRINSKVRSVAGRVIASYEGGVWQKKR